MSLCAPVKSSTSTRHFTDVRDSMDIAHSPTFRIPSLDTLLSFLSIRLKLLCHREDLDELMHLFPRMRDGMRMSDRHLQWFMMITGP